MKNLLTTKRRLEVSFTVASKTFLVLSRVTRCFVLTRIRNASIHSLCENKLKYQISFLNYFASGWLDRYIMIWRIMQILEAVIHLSLVILLPNLRLQCNNQLLIVIKTEVSSNSTYCLHSQGVDNPLDRYNERNPRLWRMCHHSCKDWVCSDQMVLQLDRVHKRKCYFQSGSWQTASQQARHVKRAIGKNEVKTINKTANLQIRSWALVKFNFTYWG